MSGIDDRPVVGAVLPDVAQCTLAALYYYLVGISGATSALDATASNILARRIGPSLDQWKGRVMSGLAESTVRRLVASMAASPVSTTAHATT